MLGLQRHRCIAVKGLALRVNLDLNQLIALFESFAVDPKHLVGVTRIKAKQLKLPVSKDVKQRYSP